MINVAEIPQIEGDLDAVEGAGQDLKSAGQGFADTGADVHATWQGLAGVYEAPEAGELFAATKPVQADAKTVGDDVKAVGSALSAYAVTVRPIQQRLVALKVDAVQFNTSIEGDDDWRKDQEKVDQHNQILQGVNSAVADWQAAERTCANAITSTHGRVQYRADDGDGHQTPGEYGYDAAMLDGATADDQGVPWGKAAEVDEPWYKDAANAVVSFGKGLVVDGLWGAVRGLGTMAKSAVEVISVRGVNEAWTMGPGDWMP